MGVSETAVRQGEETRKDILAFIRDYFDDVGYAPSIREVAQACGLRSTYSVRWHLDKLEGMGLLSRTPKVGRGMSLGLAPEVAAYLEEGAK